MHPPLLRSFRGKRRNPAGLALAAAGRSRRDLGSTERAHRLLPCRILMITSSLGSGHWRAAQALIDALESPDTGCRVRLLDFWSLMDPAVARAVKHAYLRVASNNHTAFNRLYALDQRTWRKLLLSTDALPPEVMQAAAALPPISLRLSDVTNADVRPTDRLLAQLLASCLGPKASLGNDVGQLAKVAVARTIWATLRRRAERVVAALSPDVIIATQMNGLALIGPAAIRRAGVQAVLAVPTDFGLHDLWVQPAVTHYCIPAPGIPGADRASAAGGQVVASGIPLMPVFMRVPEQTSAREQLGLGLQDPVVLLTGGGLGMGVHRLAEPLLELVPRLKLIVATAGNTETMAALSALPFHLRSRLRIIHWTEDMATLIRAADLVVGKPGGLSVAESLACGRVFIASDSLGGQENFNVRFLELHCVGSMPQGGDLPALVAALLADRPRLRVMNDIAWRLGRREGAALVAGLVRQVVPAGAPES